MHLFLVFPPLILKPRLERRLRLREGSVQLVIDDNDCGDMSTAVQH